MTVSFPNKEIIDNKLEANIHEIGETRKGTNTTEQF